MKRSTMIKKALNHYLNTVCVNEAQVERMLEVFEKLGMLPPPVNWIVLRQVYFTATIQKYRKKKVVGENF